MMPATLALRPTPSSDGRRVDAFGDADPNEPVRIAIPVTAQLSFAELLTVLVYTPGVSLMYEELADDVAIRETVQFAVLSTDLLGLDHRTEHTMAAYRGE